MGKFKMIAENLATFVQDDEIYIVEIKSKRKYGKIYKFINGYAAVELDGKQVIINEKGEEIYE